MPSAVITGASSGIGKSLAKELHLRGYTVFAGARRLESMSELTEAGVHTHVLDVTDQKSVEAFKSNVAEVLKGRGLDYLFNNAGQPCSSPIADLDVNWAVTCYDVNVFGVMRVTQAFIPMLIAAKGTIVNTGSMAGEIPYPFASVYGSSKAALHHFARSLHMELSPFGVRVITTKTAAVKTNISDPRGLQDDSIYKIIQDGYELRRTLAQRGNPQDPDDYAKQLLGILNNNPKQFFYMGSGWWRAIMFKFFPDWLRDYMIMKTFKLTEIPNRLAKLKTN